MSDIKLKKFGRTILAFVATSFLFIMVWILVDCFTEKQTATSEVIKYKIKENLYYEMTLKENQFYTSEEANESNSYVSALLDTLKVDFDYELIGTKYFNSNYSYGVLLSMTSLKNNEIVWSYDEDILPEISLDKKDVMEVNIKDSVNIDMNNVYSKAMEFKNLTGYDVLLKIEVNIINDLKVNDYDESIKDTQVLTLTMPITDKVFEIESTTSDSLSKSVLTQTFVDEKFNICLFVIALVSIIGLLPITFISYVSLFNLINLDMYQSKINKINNRYGYLIKEIKGEPNFRDKELVEVISLSLLVRLCADKDLKIYFFERYKGKEAWYYVIDNQIAYLYVLTLDYKEIDVKDIFTKKNKDSGNKKSE